MIVNDTANYTKNYNQGFNLHSQQQFRQQSTFSSQVNQLLSFQILSMPIESI